MKTICTCMIVCALSATLFAATETVNGITWQYAITNGGAAITRWTSTAAVPTSISIPETLGGVPVTWIGNYTFSDCSSLTSVVIPKSVTTIGGGVRGLLIADIGGHPRERNDDWEQCVL